jgi:type IV pilus assembly protein PilO
MSLKNYIKEVKSTDLKELNFENIHYWPRMIKHAVVGLIFFGIVYAGYYLFISDSLEKVDASISQQNDLKAEFEKKYFEASVIDKLDAQLVEINKRFDVLLRRLPTAQEVPNLIDNIALLARKTGLNVSEIQLEDERRVDYYYVMPIKIKMKGTYHMFGEFISGLSSLDRIVTVENMNIQRHEDGNIEIQMEAATYRYSNN